MTTTEWFAFLAASMVNTPEETNSLYRELIVAIAGAFIGAISGALFAFLFTLRAQRQQLKKEIENTARLEIIAAINQYLRWSVALRRVVEHVERSMSRSPVMDWHETFSEFEKAYKTIDDPSAWALRLEEYGNIFPYARESRRELVRRYEDLSYVLDQIGQYLESLHISSKNMPAETFTPASPILAAHATKFLDLSDQEHHLLIDLLFALQNRSLGKLFGNTEPPPERPGRIGPFLITNKDGVFQVVEELGVPNGKGLFARIRLRSGR